MLEHLTPHIQGKRIVELGCGTGRLAATLIERGADSYLRYDFAPSAIKIAQQRAADEGLEDRIKFKVVEIGELEKIDADFVISMGLFSWVSDDHIEHIFSITRNIDFLHNFSERRLSIRQILKFIHSRLLSSGGHHPSSRNYDAVASIPKTMGWQNVYALRHPKLYDAMCISSLPFSNDLSARE